MALAVWGNFGPSPVAFDHEGEPAIVITALGHQDNFSADWDSATAQAVRDAAAQVSKRLGWHGHSVHG